LHLTPRQGARWRHGRDEDHEGLGLESIAVCLDAGVDPARLVRDHLAEVEAAAAELERRRAKLRRLVEALDAGRVPDTPALLDALRAATPSPESAASWPAISTRTRWPSSMPTTRRWARWAGGVRAAWDDDPAGLSNAPAEQTTTWKELTRYLDLARQPTHTKEQERA
jgi:hypothetical protein